jgi:Pyruvate/2-oxoacid:ferredoxin oxidoreductase delta subunit
LVDVYEELRDLLDKLPTGCPPAPEITGILEILFTPEEARVATGLRFRPAAVEAVAEKAGVEAEEARQRLEALADKGVVFAREKDGNWGYALLPVMPGLFEFPYMKGVRSEILDRLTPLWKEYLPKLAAGFGSPSTGIMRVVPVQEEIENHPGVLTYEMIDAMIDKARVVGLAHCACREMEQACDGPREACMLFDDTCAFLVERGFGRYLSKEEMKAKLREFDEAGLVHQVNNSQDRLTLICNCCPCCCGILKARLEWGNRNVIAPSGFEPVNERDSCTACGICADERCPVGAIEIKDDEVQIDLAACIGCGLCATGCPNQAMSMRRRSEIPATPETVAEMGLSVLREQGRLERFMELM